LRYAVSRDEKDGAMRAVSANRESVPRARANEGERATRGRVPDPQPMNFYGYS
jgi:hypothetical protein